MSATITVKLNNGAALANYWVAPRLMDVKFLLEQKGYQVDVKDETLIINGKYEFDKDSLLNGLEIMDEYEYTVRNIWKDIQKALLGVIALESQAQVGNIQNIQVQWEGENLIIQGVAS